MPGVGPNNGLLVIESAYYRFHNLDTNTMQNRHLNMMWNWDHDMTTGQFD